MTLGCIKDRVFEGMTHAPPLPISFGLAIKRPLRIPGNHPLPIKKPEERKSLPNFIPRLNWPLT